MRSNIFIKFLSYFYPITTKVRTEQNGLLELTYSRGRKLLDSANANYSYGSLQRILKFGLSKVDLSKVETILLLGLGGGSVIQTLRNDVGSAGKITAVEIDKTVIDIAVNEFGLKDDPNLEIVHKDANEYVKNNSKKFDLLIVDIYIDAIVPDVFYSEQFWNNAIQLMTKNGCFIFNAGISNENCEQQLSTLLPFLNGSCKIERFNTVENTNTVVVGKKA